MLTFTKFQCSKASCIVHVHVRGIFLFIPCHFTLLHPYSTSPSLFLFYSTLLHPPFFYSIPCHFTLSHSIQFHSTSRSLIPFHFTLSHSIPLHALWFQIVMGSGPLSPEMSRLSRAYLTWLGWWKSTIDSQDYLKFASREVCVCVCVCVCVVAVNSECSLDGSPLPAEIR